MEKIFKILKEGKVSRLSKSNLHLLNCSRAKENKRKERSAGLQILKRTLKIYSSMLPHLKELNRNLTAEDPMQVDQTQIKNNKKKMD